MGVEIERKFLVTNDDWKDVPKLLYVVLEQGYLMQDDNYVLRIRVDGREGWLTIKSATSGMTRKEYEYPVRYGEALELLNQCTNRVAKHRHAIVDGGFEWTIDVFGGKNRGLILAEIEIESETVVLDLPSWLGEEVTFDERYYNANLAECPYSSW